MTEKAVEVELRWPTVPAMVREHAGLWPDREAVVDGDVTLTFQELDAEMLRVARGLMASGIERGDRVALWAPNSWKWIVAALGVMAAGAAVVPLNTRFKGAESAYVLRKSRSRALFVVDEFLGADYLGMLEKSDAELLTACSPILLTGQRDGAVDWEQFLARAETVSDDAAESRMAEVSSDDLSDIMFTSGTTGHPKGVMVSHAQTLWTFERWCDRSDLREGDRYLIINPFFHVFGFKGGWLACLMRGCTSYPMATFDLPSMLAAVEKYKITVLPGPPTLLGDMLDYPELDKYDVSSLRLAHTGATTIPPILIERLQRELYETVLTGYGITEASGSVSMCSPGDDPHDIAYFAGHPLADVQVKVVDDAGDEVARGEIGEIWVKGFNVLQGYFDDPEATAATVRPDGWMLTGDLGMLDERGYIKLVDRKKDMFIVGGFNAYPAEIEQLLLLNEDIAQATVVGAPDDRLGEVGFAFVVPSVGAAVDPATIFAWSRENMANYKVPRYIVSVDDFPMTASGKVRRVDLRDRARELIESGQVTPASSTTSSAEPQPDVSNEGA